MAIDESVLQRWQETEELLNRIEVSHGAKVNSHEIMRLGDLYVELISDLHKLKTVYGASVERKRANRLAFRAYGIIYHQRSMGIKDIFKFFLCDFPALVRRRVHFIIASALIFLMAAMVGYLCIHEKSRLIDLVIAPEEQQLLKNTISNTDANQPHRLAREPGFGLSSKIMTNNIRVSIKAFALGIFFGLGTIVVLLFNGLNLGGLASLYSSAGLDGFFWSLILPHGGIELMCIFISGGAGLIIGYALINPGSYHRRDWLIKEGNDAVKLVIGSIPLLVIAGLIEAYITPAYLSVSVKLMLSAVIFSLLMTYLVIGGTWKSKSVA